MISIVLLGVIVLAAIMIPKALRYKKRMAEQQEPKALPEEDTTEKGQNENE